jgi:hypothetical protein
MHDLNDPFTHCRTETRRLDAINNHGQIGVPRRFEQYALAAILNLVKLSLLAAAKSILCKIAYGGQHAADEVRIR